MGAEGLEDAPKSSATPGKTAKGREPGRVETTNRDDSQNSAVHPDEALRGAIKAAVDGGLYDRARALIDVLSRTSEPAAVVDIRDHRERR